MADFILSKVSQLAMSRAESQLEKSKFNIVIKVQEGDATMYHIASSPGR